MITVTIDPITLCNVNDLEHAPFVIEDSNSGRSAMKIFFETEASKQIYLEEYLKEYLDTESHGSLNSGNLNPFFDEMANNPNTRSIN